MGYSIVPRPRAASFVLAVLVASTPTCALAGGMAPESPRERSQALLVEGDTAVERGDFDEAVSYYRAAYYGLSEADRASYLGSIPIRKAIVALEQSIAQQRDPARRRQLLEAQHELLEQFLGAVRARDGAAEEIGNDVITELEGIQRAIHEALEADAPRATTEPEPATKPDPGSPPGADPHDRERRTIADFDPAGSSKAHRNWIGLGLTIGGSAVLATGLGLTTGWWTVRIGARKLADGGGDPFAEGTQERDDYLETAEAKARKFLIAGPVVAGIGLATALAGVTHLVVHRRRSHSRDTALHVVPFSSPTTGGLVLHGRF